MKPFKATICSLFLLLFMQHHLFSQVPTAEAEGNLPKLKAISPYFLDINMRDVHSFWSQNDLESRSTERWESIGPSEVISSEGLDFYVSGRVKHIDYVHKDLIRFVSASGGLFDAKRTGQKWDIKNISSHAVTTTFGGASDTSPFDHDYILYGTGDHIFGRGTGLWKTTDGGTNWERINLPNANFFHDVKFSNKPGKIWAGGNGLYSSEDNGATWKTHRYGDFSSVVIDPNRSDTVFISDNAKGIFRTFDGGSTWTKLTNGLPSEKFNRIEITICDNYPNVLYAWVCNELNATKGVWKTVDHGESWTECTVLDSNYEPVDNIHLEAGDFHSTISVSPTDPDKVLIGGWWYATTDNGEIFVGPNSGSHVDYHYATWDDEGETIFMATDGGLSYMDFDEITIFDDNVVKLKTDLIKVPTLQFVSVSTGKKSDFIVGGTQDNGFIFYHSDRDNWFYSVGDGGDVAAHYEINHAFHGTKGVHKEPLTFRNQGKFTETPNDFYDINIGLRPSGEWFRRVGNSYSPEIILFTQTDQHFYYSTNFGFQWIPYDVPAFDVGSINAMCSPNDPKPIAFVSGNGSPATSIMKVDLTKLTHEFVSEGLPIQKNISWPQVYTSPSPNLKHKVYTFIHAPNGHTPSAKIFTSDATSIKWINITGNLPDIQITSMFVHPEDENFILVGTDGFGVFASQDGGKNWNPYNTDLPQGCLITDFDYQIHGGKLYVIMATYGNGLYRSELPPSTVQTGDTKQENIRMTIHTHGDMARIFLPSALTNDIQINLMDIKGNTIANLTNITFLNEHILETSLPTMPAGVYIFNVRAGTEHYSQKVVIP
jgi:photosystem II stability/assembly factor-like uncharacterized protein